MFDVGFWELALVGVVALLVVGPERLPELARTVGFWVGRLRRMVAQVKADVEREIQADEIRRSVEEAKGLREAFNALEETRDAVSQVTRELSRDVMAQEKSPEVPDSGAHDPSATKHPVDSSAETEGEVKSVAGGLGDAGAWRAPSPLESPDPLTSLAGGATDQEERDQGPTDAPMAGGKPDERRPAS